MEPSDLVQACVGELLYLFAFALPAASRESQAVICFLLLGFVVLVPLI
jgi:hypothetical protein